MIIHHDEDEYQVEMEIRTCEFHKRHPNEVTPFCTCSMGFTQKRRDPLEVLKIKKERERKREDKILAEAEAIRARRNASKTDDHS